MSSDADGRLVKTGMIVQDLFLQPGAHTEPSSPRRFQYRPVNQQWVSWVKEFRSYITNRTDSQTQRQM